MDSTSPVRPTRREGGPRFAQVAALLAICALSGCTAVSNPLARGIPVRLLPDEALVPSHSPRCILPLTLLRRTPPDQYRLDVGDVVGVYVEGVLPTTSPQQANPPSPPVYFPTQIGGLSQRLPPAVGFPVTVQQQGTILMPLIPPLNVRGLTLLEVEESLRKAYNDADILPKGRERILVSIMQQRQTRVLVFREEIGGFTASTIGAVASQTKRGTGHMIDLPGYENDILTALAQTGGLPGLDAYDEIVVFKGGQNVPGLIPGLQAHRAGQELPGVANPVGRIVRIPLRVLPGAQTFKPEDAILETGDVLFLEARETERYYTAGLLPAGEFDVPRDRDLDIITAIAQVKGPLLNGAIGGNNLSGTLLEDGIGNPSPSMLIVLRRLPDRTVLPIRVDLTRALSDPRERILIKGGDVLVLQEKPNEAMARYLSKTFFNISLAFQPVNSRYFQAVFDVTGPQRVPGRIGVTTIQQ